MSRGSVNFQPVQDTGRNEGFVPGQNRIVSSEIRRAILDQCCTDSHRYPPNRRRCDRCALRSAASVWLL